MLLFDEVAAGPVRRLLLLLRHGFFNHDAEEVVLETSVWLFAADAEKLLSFQGQTLEPLASWFVAVACNRARDWLRKQSRLSYRKTAGTALRFFRATKSRLASAGGPFVDQMKFGRTGNLTGRRRSAKSTTCLLAEVGKIPKTSEDENRSFLPC